MASLKINSKVEIIVSGEKGEVSVTQNTEITLINITSITNQVMGEQ